MKIRLTILLMLGLATLGMWDYYHSLSVRSLQVVRIERDPQRADYRNVIYALEADFPKYPWVSQSMQDFLALRPVACFVTPDGKELVNDTTLTACRSHEREAQTGAGAIRFAMPLFINAPAESFLRNIRQQRGVWVQLHMQAMLLPFSVEAKPVFLDIAAFCKTRGKECEGILEPLTN